MIDLSTHSLPIVFRELSRLSDGDHTVFIRTEPHSLVEVRRAGIRSLPSTILAAFIPDAVIKLQTPMAASIIASVPSRQGSATLHTRTNIFIVDNMADTVNLIQHHKAAFIRVDSALAVWAKDVPSALTALRQVLAELKVLLVSHGVAHVVDPKEIEDATTEDSGPAGDAFDEFINGYDDPADKQESVGQFGGNILLPLRPWTMPTS